MHSEIINWEEFVSAVADETGITNVVNYYPTLVRSVKRTARDIGFGNTVVLKRMSVVINQNDSIKRFRLPDDFIGLEDVGTCAIGYCEGTYKIQGNYIFICDKRIEKFEFLYYAILLDGNGFPIITGNHFEAMVAGAVLLLYKKNNFQKKGNLNQRVFYENDYDDRVGDARGSDVMPSSEEEWREIASILNMSRKEYLVYSSQDKKYCCYSWEEIYEQLDDNSGDDNTENKRVYYWQEEPGFNSGDVLNMTLNDLQSKPNSPISDFLNGTYIEYVSVGKILLAVHESIDNEFSLFDNFNQNITDIVFDKFYNNTENILYYVSKNIYSNGNVYFKFQ